AGGLDGASFDGDLLLDRTADHAGAGHLLLARDAANNRARGLVGNHPLQHAGIGLGLRLRHAAVARDLALLFLDLRPADRDQALAGNLLADALHARAGALLPHGARNPHLHGLGAHRAGLAAIIAAVLVTITQLRQPLPEGRAARNFPAFIMTLVHTLAHD